MASKLTYLNKYLYSNGWLLPCKADQLGALRILPKDSTACGQLGPGLGIDNLWIVALSAN